jgi:carbamoylphosphate synthase large subunit
VTSAAPTPAAGAPAAGAPAAGAPATGAPTGSADAFTPAGVQPARQAARTLGTLALLSAALPLNLTVTGLALVTGPLRASRSPLPSPAPDPAIEPRRTVLISGGKMTKALHLARAFHRAGHRVILVESERYRLTGHRFSRAVARFHTIPAAGEPGYAQALVDIVVGEEVDVYVPVCSPASARDDALARATLSEHCEVLHFDPETLTRLDDKEAFSRAAAAAGLPVPDAHRITDPGQVLDFDFDAEGRHPPYVLKSIAYDPIRRLDMTPLPQPDEARTRAFLASRPISEANPWVMQAFIDGTEYCTHTTARDGQVAQYCCCESSASQLNYEQVDVPAIEAWVRRFVAFHRLTGQVSFDFIRSADDVVYAIECNPRTHSAITMFYDHPDVARAYLDDDVATVTPRPQSRPTYWLYHELWRALRDPRHGAGPLRRILRGREAIFDWGDPLPFLMVHHAQIPALLMDNLRHGRPWLKIDFNIGKLVEPGGD